MKSTETRNVRFSPLSFQQNKKLQSWWYLKGLTSVIQALVVTLTKEEKKILFSLKTNTNNVGLCWQSVEIFPVPVGIFFFSLCWQSVIFFVVCRQSVNPIHTLFYEKFDNLFLNQLHLTYLDHSMLFLQRSHPI